MPVDADTHQVGLVDLQGRLRSLVTQLDEAPSGLALDIYTASPGSLNTAGNDGAVDINGVQRSISPADAVTPSLATSVYMTGAQYTGSTILSFGTASIHSSSRD